MTEEVKNDSLPQVGRTGDYVMRKIEEKDDRLRFPNRFLVDDDVSSVANSVIISPMKQE